MASLQAALKSAIQRVFQLEDNELAAEVLPDQDNRRSILFYEASEGGAGVLKRLIEDSGLWSQVLEEALKLCHFDKEGNDLGRAEGASEDCVAACYDCLLSYYNQFDHRNLNRRGIKDLLLLLRDATLDASPSNRDRQEHLDALLRVAGSSLEQRWLKFLADYKFRLPDEGQVLVDSCRTRPDFLYRHHSTVIYVDGPPHDFPERQLRDQQQTACMEDQGYTVIRFGHDDDWMARVSRYPEIFGRPA
jgi:very-short-patch-repair endonuclease